MKKICNFENLKKVLLGLGIFVIFLLCPWLLEKILDFFQYIGIVNCCTKEDYFSFYSTFLGGTIALIGVWITLRDEKKSKEKDDSIKYKPILKVIGINLKKSCILREVHFSLPFHSYNCEELMTADEFYKQINNPRKKFRLYLKNVGRGESINTIVEKAEISDVSWDKESELRFKCSESQFVGEICCEDLLGIDFYLPDYLFMHDDLTKRNNSITITLYVNYSDMFNRVKYQEKIHLMINVLSVSFSDKMPCTHKGNLKWSEVNYGRIEIMPCKNIFSDKTGNYEHESYFYKD